MADMLMHVLHPPAATTPRDFAEKIVLEVVVRCLLTWRFLYPQWFFPAHKHVPANWHQKGKGGGLIMNARVTQAFV